MYRSRLQIIRDILVVASGDHGKRKSRIMYDANLGYKVLKRYLDELLSAGLLEFDGKSHYRVTKKGVMFLTLYEDYEADYRDLREWRGKVENEKRVLTNIMTS